MRAISPVFPATTARFGIAAALPLALVLAAISLGGILVPALYARETPALVLQARGQDWFDLVLASPWLAICGLLARRGSWTWRALLAGAYAYTAYELAIYVFAIHFNSLFLLYCAGFGLSIYALVAIAIDLARVVPARARHASRVAASFLVAIALLFAALWLADVVPATMRGAPSAALIETGLFTNPVHVLDLSLVIPLHVIAAVLIWRARESGELLAPIVLAFGVPMALSIAGMMIVIRMLGGAAPTGVIVMITAVAVIEALVLLRLVRAAQR